MRSRAVLSAILFVALQRIQGIAGASSPGGEGAPAGDSSNADRGATCEIRSYPKRLPARGGGFNFSAVAKDAGGKLLPNVAFVWSASNFAVALIDPKTGRVTTETPGDITIMAKGKVPDGSAVLCTADLTVENSYQDVLVSGRVVRSDGSTVSGAAVRAAGGPPVQTDEQGNFAAIAWKGPHAEGATITAQATAGTSTGQAAGTVSNGIVEGLTITLSAAASSQLSHHGTSAAH